MNDELITIFTPNNQAEYLVIKSMLENQGIRTWTRNEHVQNLFGMGQLGAGYNFITGPIKILIHAHDETIAREIIENYLSSEQQISQPDSYLQRDSGYSLDPDSLNDEILLKKYLTRSLLFNFFWIFGIGSIIGVYYAERARALVGKSSQRLTGTGYILFLYLYGIGGILIAVLYFKGLFI